MTEAIIPPTPERSQHDEIAIRAAGRKNKATVHVKQPYEIWHDRRMIDDRQRDAAKIYCEDVEATSGKVRSSLASLDRVDYSAMGIVEAEAWSESEGRLIAVRSALGPALASAIHAALIDRLDLSKAMGRHKDAARGMVVAALEVMAVTYGFRS